MAMVTYRRWSFTRGSNCKALMGKVLVFWIGGRVWDLVAYERWLKMEFDCIYTDLVLAKFGVQLQQELT